ncbi:hypothetical protein G6F42_021456 [Rhizopus arrhizus]|nr:hypothetical protein G6F42_021456 [Rhizopus arrhizus]
MTAQRSKKEKKIIRHWQQDTPKIDEREMANAQTKDLCCKHGRVLNTLSTLPAAGCLDGSNHERRAIKAFVEQCCTASAHGDHHGVYPPYFDAIVAGGIGGSAADCLMHSVDTVKTRLQGQPLNRSTVKYHNMVQAYKLIFKEEGILRGLYAGVTPAMLGSIPGTALYFGIYEFTKRNLTANNIPEIVSHLAAGSLGDLAASIVYVPSEVLKTRMQLQGKYNNPHFVSGYNYKGTWHAARTIVKYDGFGALFHGFRATILRDVPYSALQFAFYGNS